MAKRRLLATITTLGFSGMALAAQASQTLVPAQSEIRFTGKQMGAPSEGRFQQFTVDAALEPAAIEKSRVRIVIDMNGVALSVPDLTTEIKRKRWFDVASFPTATFEAKQFRSLGDGRYEVNGALTLKGVTHDVAAPFTLTTVDQDMVAAGQLELKRLDFNVGDGPWADTDTVANEVQIAFKLRLAPQP